MKKKNWIHTFVLFSLIFNLSTPLFAEEKKEEEEIPQVIQDIRRFEIITLGSLPFVFLDANLVNSGIKYFQNGSEEKYKPSTEDKEKLLLTSLGICVGIGITDLIINIVKRNKEKKRQELRNTPIVIEPIVPIAEDPEAIKLDKLEQTDNTTEDEE